jgi:hypothetical protein
VPSHGGIEAPSAPHREPFASGCARVPRPGDGPPPAPAARRELDRLVGAIYARSSEGTGQSTERNSPYRSYVLGWQRLDPNQTSISTRKRDTLRCPIGSGRAGTMERKVFRSVTGAITCAAAGNLASPAFSEAATLPCSSSADPMGRNDGDLSHPVTTLANPYELRAARSSRCEGALLW